MAVWRGVWRAYAYGGSVWGTSAVTRGLGTCRFVKGRRYVVFVCFFSVNNVLCVPACFHVHRSCGSAAMCVEYMRVAWHANGRPAKPWKARHVQVNVDLCDVICAYGISGDRALCVCASL